MKNHRSVLHIFIQLMIIILLTACASGGSQTKSLDFALSQYEKAVRWSQWDVAAALIAPEYLEDNPVSQLDMDRLRLFRVTQYNVRSSTPFDEGLAVRQAVEIRMFRRDQAVERSLIDQQEWRYDAEMQRWFLHSGLPDVARAR